MSLFFLILLVTTLFSAKILGKNETRTPERTDIVSSCMLLLLFGGYWFYVRKEIEKKIVATIDRENGLQIGKRVYKRHAVKGFMLEVNHKKQMIQNITFLVNNNISRHTLLSDHEEIEAFTKELKQYIPFVEKLPEWRFHKLLRILKI